MHVCNWCDYEKETVIDKSNVTVLNVYNYCNCYSRHWVKYGDTLNITLIFQGAFEYDFQVSSIKQCLHWIYGKCLDTYLIFHFKNTIIFVSQLFCENNLKIVISFQVVLRVCHSLFMSVFMCNRDHCSHYVLSVAQCKNPIMMKG